MPQTITERIVSLHVQDKTTGANGGCTDSGRQSHETLVGRAVIGDTASNGLSQFCPVLHAQTRNRISVDVAVGLRRCSRNTMSFRSNVNSAWRISVARRPSPRHPPMWCKIATSRRTPWPRYHSRSHVCARGARKHRRMLSALVRVLDPCLQHSYRMMWRREEGDGAPFCGMRSAVETSYWCNI